MGVQQQLLQKLGDSLVLKFQQSIEQTKATGRTAASIHAVSGDNFVEVWGARSLGALEYGRKPTSTTTKGNPTLFEAIKEWAMAKGIVSGDKKSMGIVYAITQKIHREGTLLYHGTDFYGNTKPSKRISGVIEQLNLDTLLREVTALKVNEYSSDVIRELKQLQ